MAPAFRRGDENRPQRWILASSRVNGTAVPGSLSEGAAERSEAEGVSFVGCSGPMVYTMALFGSEIFEWLRSSGDTPSVTPFGRASSLREGAGNDCAECVPFNEVLAKPQGFGRFSSPLRNSEDFGLVPFNVPLGNRKGAGDFHRPYEGSDFFTFHRSSEYLLKSGC